MLQLPLDLPNLREWGGRGRGRGNVATFRHMLQLTLNLPHLQEGGQEEGWGNAVPFRRMLQQPLNLPHLWQERRGGPEGSGIILREGDAHQPPIRWTPSHMLKLEPPLGHMQATQENAGQAAAGQDSAAPLPPSYRNNEAPQPMGVDGSGWERTGHIIGGESTGMFV